MGDNDRLVSVVLPTYNERENIEELIGRTLTSVQQPVEVIVVDDNSPDGTWQVVQAMAEREPRIRLLRRVDERGLTSALMAGIGLARAEAFTRVWQANEGAAWIVKKALALREYFRTVPLYIRPGDLLAGAIVLVFSKTIIRDINKLNQTATKISHGQMGVMVDVKRKDEIGELAESFSRMQASLKIMMNHDEKSNESEK